MKIERVGILGLGYVGLPLAVALARDVAVVGYDIWEPRVAELRRGRDRTGEVAPDALAATEATFTADPEDLRGADAFLITVPTPVDEARKPDLSAVAAACQTVGSVLAPGAVVVLESTVYPGTVEGFCAPLLEKSSGLGAGRDFFLGYSPERINPGDPDHGLGRITKVVAGQTDEVREALAMLYGRIGPVHEVPDIRIAEAAKVIENAQRDINIAFVNELALIFHRLGLDTGEVLEAAGTKWNFLPFRPGLVGGHCVGVDPYYLTYLAEKDGYHPEVILAGRRINDNMGRYIGAEVARLVIRCGLPKRALVLGITFKENVPDIRNTGSADVVREVESFGIEVDLHDPLAEPAEVEAKYGMRLIERPDAGYGAVILTVAHDYYAGWDVEEIEGKVVEGGVVADVKGVWRGRSFSDQTRQWRL